MYQWLRELMNIDVTKAEVNMLVGEADWISVNDKFPENNDLCYIKVEYTNINTNNKTFCHYKGTYKKEGLWMCPNTPLMPNHAIRVTHWILRKGVK